MAGSQPRCVRDVFKLNVAAERLESRFKCITEAAQRKRKNMPEAPETQTDPADPPPKKAVQTQVSSRCGVPRRETFNSFSEGRELDWTLSGLLELLYGCWGCERLLRSLAFEGLGGLEFQVPAEVARWFFAATRFQLTESRCS